jgi:hypothetical protein
VLLAPASDPLAGYDAAPRPLSRAVGLQLCLWAARTDRGRNELWYFDAAVPVLATGLLRRRTR